MNYDDMIEIMRTDCRVADWHYERSDDMRKYKIGETQVFNAIRKRDLIINNFPERINETKKIWNSMVAKEWQL